MNFIKGLIVITLTVMLANGAMAESKTDSNGKAISRTSLHHDLKHTPQTLNDFYYLDELKAIGENGGSGGFGKQWWEDFTKAVETRRTFGNESIDYRMINGLTYTFERSRIPSTIFDEFEVFPIVSFQTYSHGSIRVEEVYKFHFLSSWDDRNPQKLKDILAIELIDGEMITGDSIMGVELEINIQPPAQTDDQASQDQASQQEN